MKDIIHCKFSQYLNLAKKLCDTGELHIGEAVVKVKYYGTGLSLHHKDTTSKDKWQTNKCDANGGKSCYEISTQLYS